MIHRMHNAWLPVQSQVQIWNQVCDFSLMIRDTFLSWPALIFFSDLSYSSSSMRFWPDGFTDTSSVVLSCTCVVHSLTFHLETKMPWCQTPSPKKNAVEFTTVMTSAYHEQLNVGFLEVCEIIVATFPHHETWHWMNCDCLFDMSVKWPHGRALANESCHGFQTFSRQSEGLTTQDYSTRANCSWWFFLNRVLKLNLLIVTALDWFSLFISILYHEHSVFKMPWQIQSSSALKSLKNLSCVILSKLIYCFLIVVLFWQGVLLAKE